MVSWEAHRVLGDLICSFHSGDIDRMVDEAPHNASRYDAGILERNVTLIRDRYGDRGLRYLVLHHYIDRLTDILTSLISNYYESYALGYSAGEIGFREIYQRIRSDAYEMVALDPKNILTLLAHGLKDVLSALHLFYGGRRKRRQRKQFEELIRRAYADISSSEALQGLRDIVVGVLGGIRQNLDRILCAVLTDEGFRSRGTIHRILGAVRIKAAKYVYYVRTRSPGYSEYVDRLLDEEKLVTFIDSLVELACGSYREEEI